MAESTFTAGYSASAILQAYSDSYADTHDASTGNVDNSLIVGQHKDVNGDFWIHRAFVFFDTSPLSDDCLIKSATLALAVTGDYSDTDFNVVIRKGSSGAPHNPLISADYEYSQYSGNGGSKMSEESPLNIILNSTGKGWIDKTGWTEFAIISGNDINYVQPTGKEYVLFGEYDHPIGLSRPKLIIEYYVSTGIPAVGNPTFSNTKANYTIATANVSDDGGGYVERGFEYGTSEEAMWAVRETGVFTGTGNFSLSISGLQPSTTIYVRAFLSNSYGTGYSEWVSFNTTASPSYGIYEESNSLPDSDGIYANSNTICFYVRKVGGKWSIKHGPYTSDQIDIEITKILIEGKGKYQIKFESDVLTGLSSSVMCKLDIKVR